MKRTEKYVGLDVHQATTAAAVRESGGRVLARAVFPTEEPAIMEFFGGTGPAPNQEENPAPASMYISFPG